MKIQFISYDGRENYQTKETIENNNFNNAKSFDEFDLNIISLQNEQIWRNENNTYTNVNCSNDLTTLNTQIYNSKNSIVCILLPQNYYFKYDKIRSENKYYYEFQLKDSIQIWSETVLGNSLFKNWFNGGRIIYDNSTTIINGASIESTFSFNVGEAQTMSTGNQITSIKFNKRMYLTGLNFKSKGFNLDSFLKTIGLIENKTGIPDWLKQYEFYNDKELMENLENEEERLRNVKTIIQGIQEQINENMNYKTALIATGEQLVSIVFNIIQIVLSCDLSDFKDENKEDFLIKKNEITFIGEIKGITSNVKSEHISQLEVHYQGYMDKLQEENSQEIVKALLIINPFRNKPIDDRDEIHINQINLAKRNESLIITTDILLKLFEKYKQNEIDNESVVKLLKEKTGLLTEKDF